MWSLHMFSGEYWPQLLLMVVAGIFAIWLLIGYRTRLSAIASWLLLLSLDARNPMILNSGDTLLRCMLLWSLFLPLGAKASVDSLFRPPRESLPNPVVSFASGALLLQLCLMYWFAALFKTDPVWIKDFSGVYYALHCDAFVTPLGLYLRQFPTLLKVLTLSTYLLELIGPIIAFVPVFNGCRRTLLVVVFVLFHLGLAMTMEIGLFAPICIVAWLTFLPADFWDMIDRRVNASFVQRGIARLAVLLSWCAHRFRVFRRPETPYCRCSWPINFLVVGLFIYVCIWNVRGLDPQYWEPRILPKKYHGLAHALGLNQYWSMFAPIPRTEDGWYIIRGTLRDGSIVNLWQPDESLPVEKPKSVSATYLTQRWRKYLDNLTLQCNEHHRRYFSDWLQRRWNQRYSGGKRQREVVKVESIHRLEHTPEPGEPFPGLKSVPLWTAHYK